MVGLTKTLSAGFPFVIAVIMGTMTGCGGGLIRDVLLNELPLVFRQDFYALSCVFGGWVYYAAQELAFLPSVTHALAAFAVIISRLVAVQFELSVPVLRPLDCKSRQEPAPGGKDAENVPLPSGEPLEGEGQDQKGVVMMSKEVSGSFKGNDILLFGMIAGVLSFWLFAQSAMNVSSLMAAELGLDDTIRNFAVSMTALFSGIFIVLMGGLADRVGRVKVLRIGFVLSIAGALLVGLAPVGKMAAPVLLLGRALQGFSGACIMPASLALVKAYWEGPARQRALSLWSIGSFGGAGFASLFGGLVSQNFGWRMIFYSSAAVTLAGLLMVWSTPESKVESEEEYKFDVPGVLAFMVTMVSLQMLVSKGHDFGWGSPLSISLAALTVIAAIVFFRVETRSPSAFIDFNLFSNKIYVGATLSNFLLNGVMGMLMVSMLLVQKGAGMTAQQAGMLTLGYALVVVLFIRVGEKLLQRFGHRKPMVWGILIVALSVFLLMFTNVMTAVYKVLAILAYSFLGLGLAFYATPSMDAALSNLPDNQSGAGAGIYKMASSLGASFGIAISAGIFTALSSGTEPIKWISGMITFVGRQDNTAIRQAALVAFGFNLMIVLMAALIVMLTVPKSEK